MSSVFMRAGAAVLAAAALLAVPSPALAQAVAGPVLPPSGGVVYVTNAGSGNVSSLAIGPRATLKLLGKPVSTDGKTPRGIALTPDGATAYVVNSDSDTLSVFRVGAQGALQPNPRIVKTGDEPWGATVSPNGRTLYVTNTGVDDATISAYRIGLDGTPTKLGDFKTTSDHPKQTVLSPDGRFLYLSYADADETADSPPRVITRYTVLPDGTLGPAQDVARAGPANYGITMSPDGGLLYVTSNVAQNVWGFRVGKDGSLKPVPGMPVSVRDPVGLKVTPDGQHLYVCANFDAGSPPGGLLGFTIHADGSLTPTADSPAPTDGTSAVAITPDGQDIFANIQDTSQVVAFAIESGGTLKQAPGSPFPTGGKHPLSQSVAVRPVPAATPQ
ncbi:beta-propeller fold lactonase family protein [Nonomuraea sp. NEAU-A123]|uniref:lactonase family protein n=1 Tax=Nonomuraea sp. NEAU-A123 TaxID=2839649 RepID=UPI001BE499FB|nr:beta-propeller fold lactonase family protein [Nonomuraea sp. NEAU-A123]MBT2226436.1 beta-propeller fold lactonase family protein [Nonomuraea sp. NEAU-A123]